MPASHEFNILRCEIRTGVIIFIKRQEAPVAQPDSIPMSIWHGPNLQSKTSNHYSNFNRID
jgi:hypothetical protein